MNGRAGSTDEPLPEGRHAGRFLLAGLLVLAVGATVILVFSESTEWLRIGVLAGLWAALIGGLVAAKYRGQVAERRSEAAELQELYELELEREVAARREYELELEADAREQAADEHSKQIAALREEMRVLRENLEALVGGEVLVERVALRAESTRMRSLQEGTGRARGMDSRSLDSRSMDPPRQRALQPSQVVEGQAAERRRPERPAAPPPPPNAERTVRAAPVTSGRGQDVPKRKPVQPPPQPAQKPVQPAEQPRRVQYPQPVAREQAGSAQPSRPAEAEPAATSWWDASELNKPQEPARPAARRKDPELPRRQPGTSGAPRPAWAGAEQDDRRPTRITEGLDPNWTPSWEVEQVADAPVEQRRNGAGNAPRADDGPPTRSVPAPMAATPPAAQTRAVRPLGQPPAAQPPAAQPPAAQPAVQPPAAQPPAAQPAAAQYGFQGLYGFQEQGEYPAESNGQSRFGSAPERPDQQRRAATGIPPDERPPEGRTAGSRHGRPDSDELPVTTFLAPPGASSGGRRRKPEPEEAPSGGGRRRKPEPEETSGGRRRKPEEFADPEFGGGWTIRHEQGNGNGSGNGSGNGHRAAQPPEEAGAHADGRSVSDLLASFGDSGGGRRRRRED